jgi:hypothetical protein
MKLHKSIALLLTTTVAIVVAGAILHGNPTSLSHAADLDFSMPGQPTDRAPERYTGSFLDTSLTAMLQRLNVTVNVADKVYAFPEPELGVGSTILVYRAQVVQLTDGRTTKEVHTWAKTVADFAAEQNLDLAEKDRTSLAADAPVPVQETAVPLTVTRVAESELVLATSIPFTTQYKDDSSMNKGTNVTDQAGKNGTLKTTYLVHREDGVETSRKVTRKETALDPVTEIIRRGTKPVITVRCAYNDTVAAAAAQYGVDPNSLCYRMMAESNGHSTSVNPSGPYIGLFQYADSTWARYAGPAGYGGASILDPIAQIYVTAWAWSHGHRSAWPTP